jgi:hypothetical protein
MQRAIGPSEGGLPLVISIAFTGELMIPIDAPPSFYARSNDVLWDIDLRIDMPNCPDWTETVALAVRPGKRESIG